MTAAVIVLICLAVAGLVLLGIVLFVVLKNYWN